MTFRRTAMLTLSVLLAACNDPLGPCDGEFACQVAGIDLAITDVRIVSGDRTGTDAVTGLPIYGAGAMTAAVTVVNRGDSIFPGQQSESSAAIPALRPGERHEYLITADFTGRVLPLRTGDDPRMVDVTTIFAALPFVDADVDADNNSAQSIRFHLAVPVVDIDVSVGQRSELRANEPFVASFAIRNRSVHGAALDSSAVVLCMVDFDLGCWGSWPYFGKFDLPSIDAGWHHENAYLASAPPEALVWQEEAHEAHLTACVVQTRDAEPYADSFGPCGNAVAITVRPDYAACSPPVLQLGVAITLARPNCGQRSVDDPGTFSVLALDAVAGTTYQAVSSIDAVAVYDADGEPADLPGAGISFAEDGRYYLVIYHYGPVSLTVDTVPEGASGA